MTAAFSTILVPTDFSPGSRLALDYALALAGRLRAGVHVVHVVEDPAINGIWTETYLDMNAIREGRKAEAGRLMQNLLKVAGAEHATSEIVIGPVSETIATAAANCGADIIVMGTHGRTGLAHVLVGSVAERVIRLSACPVMTVREGALAATRAAPAAIRPAAARR